MRAARRAAMPPDTWERHRIVAEIVGGSPSVLDVGGVAGELALFLPFSEVTSVNLQGQGDIDYDGRRLPFADSAFDTVVSLDVLEHMSADERPDHVRELARVARRRIVACSPLGTDAHVEAEREVARWYRELTGEGHPFLEEHLRFGLPTQREFEQLARRIGGSPTVRYQGDFEREIEAFRAGVLVRRHPRPSHAVSYLRRRVARSRSPRLDDEPTARTNRAFLIAELDGSG